MHFFHSLEALMTSWGVSLHYTGTCILVPEDWRPARPLDLMALFSVDNVPAPGSARAWYSYRDHGTTLARARAWFSAFRTGTDFDNFMGTTGYQPMDASHLCHHEHCIVHVEYEPADINQERNECARHAKFLRSDRRHIPEECARHNPPCMMQVGLRYHRCCRDP